MRSVSPRFPPRPLFVSLVSRSPFVSPRLSRDRLDRGAVCRTVESGVGIAVLPWTAAQRAQPSMAIRVVPLSDPWSRRRHSICVRNFKALPAHAQRLVGRLRARASRVA